MENIDIDIDIDKEISENIDIDEISNRLEFGISNRATDLLVPGCKEPSTLVRSPRHAVTRTGEGGSQ